MANVLIAESDTDLRTLLDMLVLEAGHSVTTVTTEEAAMATLLHSVDSYVVLLDSHLGGDHLAAVALLELAHQGALLRPAFVLLSTDSMFRLPPSLQLLRGLLALPVVDMPFAADDLLHEVEWAEERLSRWGAGAPLAQMERGAPPVEAQPTWPWKRWKRR